MTAPRLGNPDVPYAEKIDQGHHLRGSMSPWELGFTVLSFSAPLIAMTGTTPVVISIGNGIGAPVAYILAACLVLVFAVGFCAMTQRIERPGGFYAYISASLGKPLGLGCAFVAVFGYLTFLVGVYPLLGSATNAFVHGRLGGSELPWWTWSSLGLVIVAVLGYYRINLSAKIIVVLLLAEVAIIAVFDGAVLLKGGGGTGAALSTEPFTFHAFKSGSTGVALMFTILTFIGFEATAVYRDEVRNPHRSIPLATYGAVTFMGVFYTLTTFLMINAWGVSDAVRAATDGPSTFLSDPISRYVGGVFADAMVLLLVTSTLAAIIAVHNTATRYLFSLGADGAAPRSLGRVQQRTGSPFIASLVVSALSVAALVPIAATRFSAEKALAWFLGIGTFALVVLYAITSVAIIVFFWRFPGAESAWVRLVAPVLGLLGFGLTLLLATRNLSLLIGGSTGLSVVFQAVVYALLVAGFLVALVFRRRFPAVYEGLGRSLAS